jgi:ammonium transporter, Amt family
MIMASALVLLMIPGISLYYSGVSKPKSTLTLVRLPLITTAVVGSVVGVPSQVTRGSAVIGH